MPETHCCPCGCGRAYEVAFRTENGTPVWWDLPRWREGHGHGPEVYGMEFNQLRGPLPESPPLDSLEFKATVEVAKLVDEPPKKPLHRGRK